MFKVVSKRTYKMVDVADLFCQNCGGEEVFGTSLDDATVGYCFYCCKKAVNFQTIHFCRKCLVCYGCDDGSFFCECDFDQLFEVVDQA